MRRRAHLREQPFPCCMIAVSSRAPAVWTLGVALMVLGLGGVCGPTAQAQQFGRIAETETNAAYFYYAQPGEATIQVALWGVPQPGLYEVPDSTNLDRLLTLAGGIQMQTRQENRKPPRIMVRHYRPAQSRQELLLETRIQNLLQGEVDAPELRENDVIVVETIQPSEFTFQDALSIVSTVSSLTLLVLRIIRFSD
jgi:hypothetical protein